MAHTFDYVIVGAGSAGCVLANRLSADPSVQVLLLEAGPRDRDPRIRIPAAFSKLFRSAVDWDFWTEPSDTTAGRSLYWPRGRVLGGSSSINAMIYIRGNRADYDDWAATGCDGWSFDEVLPYFIRSEHNENGENEYHGVGGPLNVADQRDPNPLTRAWVEAGVQAGFERNRDFNAERQEGVGIYQATQKNGARHSASAAFLAPVRRRSNLTIWSKTLVLRIRTEDNRAVGVLAERDGREIFIRADREVVLAAGAIGSPQLLMLSGIGDADELQRHDIRVVADLGGVGRNLQDHPIVGVRYRSSQPISLMNAESLQSLAQYLITRRGMLTSILAEGGGFVSTRGDDRPDIQFHFGPVFFDDHGFVKPTEHAFSIGPTLIRPLSRGTLTLRSTDPSDKPLLHPNYLSHPADIASLAEGIRIAREIAHQAAFDPYRGDEMAPSASAVDTDSIERYIRETCETLYHPSGTCSMGIGEEAVVDPELRVHGVENLRVVDASIMPTVIAGNTNAPVMMIAEKAADLILGRVPATTAAAFSH
ncbi:GMC family oxidoreductase N-terminal domain-containing protein [soil metagenome]